MSYEQQLLKLQEIIKDENLKLKLYVAIKDPELYDYILKNNETYVIYENFEMFIFKEVNTRNIQNLADGKYDGTGIRIRHNDFWD